MRARPARFALTAGSGRCKKTLPFWKGGQPMFIDIAKIKIVSGKGGDGKVGFHREKYIASGGPDGGDGGRGGSVIFKVDDNLSTLMDFRYKKKYVAAAGENGGSKRCKGKDGADLVIRVPRGTIIRDQKTGQV